MLTFAPKWPARPSAAGHTAGSSVHRRGGFTMQRKDIRPECRRGKKGAQAGRNFIAALKAVSHQSVIFFESTTQNKRPLTWCLRMKMKCFLLAHFYVIMIYAPCRTRFLNLSILLTEAWWRGTCEGGDWWRMTQDLRYPRVSFTSLKSLGYWYRYTYTYVDIYTYIFIVYNM